MNDFENVRSGSSSYTIAEPKLGFFGALLGLIFAPRTTLKTLLLSYRVPPYGFSIPFFLLLVLIVPSAAQLFNSVHSPTPLIALVAFMVTFYATFILFQSWILFLFAVDLSPSALFALTGYMVAPIAIGLLFLFVVDYALTKHLELLFLYNLGESVKTQIAAVWLGIFEIYACLLIVYISANGLQIAANLFLPSTIFFGALSVIPIIAAFLISLLVASKINPPFPTQFESFFTRPLYAVKTTLLHPDQNLKFRLLESK
jgi:hypothetical protein